jgi:hypothetical protein
MDNSLFPFAYDPAYPFLFCTICRYAVLVSSTSEHLKNVHKDVIPIELRKAVKEAAAQLQNMYQRKEEVEQYRLPSPGDAAIPHLREPAQDGLRCDKCGWITTSMKRMRAHYQKTHQGSDHSGWRTNVRCQQLFAKGPHSVWFEVEREEEDVFSNEVTAWLQESDRSGT